MIYHILKWRQKYIGSQSISQNCYVFRFVTNAILFVYYATHLRVSVLFWNFNFNIYIGQKNYSVDCGQIVYVS